MKINFPRDRLYKYKLKNSLEQSYQYRIHIEPDIGPPIHLIDPKSASVPNVPLAEEDRELLKDDDDHFVKGSNYAHLGNDDGIPDLERFVKTAERARRGRSWLLKTQYLDNNLKKSVHNYTSEADIVRRKREEFESEMKAYEKESQKPLKERILETFEVAGSDELPKHKKGLKPVKILDVVPSLDLCENEYYHVSFDSPNILPEDSDKLQDRSSKAKYILNHSRLFTKGNNVALLIPTSKKSLLDDDDENVSENLNLKRLREVREFQYSVRQHGINERFAFLWDQTPAKEVNQVKRGTVSFLRLEEAGVEMKRQSTSNKKSRKQAQEYDLKERPLNDEENESRKKRKTELVEGTYDEDNDSNSDKDDMAANAASKSDMEGNATSKLSAEVSSGSSSSGSDSDSDSS